jgi:signal transduction histidine kinase
MKHSTFREKFSSSASILLIILLGIGAMISVYYMAEDQERQTLIERSALVASSLDANEIKALSGNESDLSNPVYISIKQRLMNMRAVTSDVRFMYLTAMKDGRIFFLADSEDPKNVADYSPPGQAYDEASKHFYDLFQSKKGVLEVAYADRWGNWVSSLSPFIDPVTGNVLAVIGVDIDSKTYYSTIIFYSLIPAFITLILVLIAILNRTIVERERENVRLRSEFIAVASHELRAPITGIKWVLQTIEEAGQNLTGPQKVSISRVMEHCEQLLGTVNNILDIAALERGKFALGELVPCNLYGVIHEAVDNLEYVAKERKIDVKFVGEWNTIGDEVLSDKNRLRMAFANIISNSIKYSPEGGMVEISKEKAGKNFRVTITDHGVGIPLKDQKKVFRGFYRSENAIKTAATGTGLGLYYSKIIFEMHGGNISLRSEEKKGTSVITELPIA